MQNNDDVVPMHYNHNVDMNNPLDVDEEALKVRFAARLCSFLDLAEQLNKDDLTQNDISQFTVGIVNLVCDSMGSSPKRDLYRRQMVDKLEPVLSRHLIK
ncbi:hypothetical protein RAY_279 [Erwinia phage vB_EamM_RAY]|jgi:hypothetical protein|uniref:Uncharacterized protein n=10 Tax=Agricanvirus TaxID=1984776 RepID=A0A173GF59_9CAUD|nr:hypothetical protein Ea357_275 [Erwinia phage Ea35-70]YP_009605428.1 hypothetical protein FDH97_gp285 [Erwinia phage vB_EamM_Deimos-Minion]YP_009605745.1 hypothetical protein FDH98_gp239 [Erwinia phage vB_EamM_RAY]YP_009606067.1 hypothetical protein FDH99_gp242 [Erwinia phage vB_EamM_Simmy50]YP_009606388.1 hypothetical protein FDI00_gp282 [Erwinia phage vB_EamM_Special G]YP_009622022.1 hypothetical protein FDJ23_gp281 [Erwinia phage vB_EamM_Desertfox]AUG86068.1 hypothetical protein BOSOLAP